MDETIGSKPPVLPELTNMPSQEPVAKAETTGLLPTDEKHTSTSYYPSRQTVNTIYNIARTVNKIYPNDMGDDDMDDDDDDDDDDEEDDDDDMDDDNDEDDDEVDELREGDEPLPEQSHNEIASGTRAAAANGLQALSAPAPVNNARNPTAARYKFTPEKIEPENPTASKGIANTEQNKAQTTQPSAASQSKTPASAKGTTVPVSAASTAVPKTQSASVQAQPEPNVTKTQPPVPKAQPEANVTDASPPAALTPSVTASKTVANPTPAKVDPLAPTAAAPFGYKIVSVKKPDGTIAKVKRPLKEGEKPPVPATKKPAPAKAVTQPSAQSTAPASTAGVSTNPVTNEKAAPAVASNTPKTVNKNKEVETAPTLSQAPAPAQRVTSTTTKLPEVSEKEIGAVQVSEKELEQATTPQNATPAGDQFKGARALAKVMKFIIWTVAILFPLFFLALAIVTAVLKGHKLPQQYVSGTKTDPLSQAIKVAASAWPIVFAAVVAQTLKMYAAHRVERGIKLMTLEQLISSHSVGGAIKQPFMLRTFNVTTLILFLIWCLSPLAGQAILRMSSTISNYDTVATVVSYYSSETVPQFRTQYPPFTLDPLFDEHGVSPYFEGGILFALVQGFSQTQYLAQDIFRNVKIPFAPGTAVAAPLPPGSHLAFSPNYASLLGVPYWINDTGYPDQVTQYSVLSQHFTFNCSDPVPIDVDSNVMLAHNLSYSPERTLTISAENNTHANYSESLGYNKTNLISYMQPGPQGVLYFASFLPISSTENTTVVNFAKCPYQAHVVNTTIYCNGVEGLAYCTAGESTEVPELASTAKALGWLFPAILQNTGIVTGPYDWSPLEQFIINPYFAAHQNNSDYRASDYGIANVTGLQLSERLTPCVNTLWNLDWDGNAFMGPDQSSWNNLIEIKNVSATKTLADYREYTVSWPWIGVLIGCSVLLLIAAFAAAIWESRVVGPDFLGFANTAVKKSVKMPKAMSTMDARDRLHALHECEVLLQDVRPDREVGRIALGVKEEGSTRLIQGRRYR